MELFLSIRGKECMEMPDPALTNLSNYWENPWTPDNITGNVNMSTADNNLSRELLTEKLTSKEISEAVITKDIFRYPKPGGMPNTVQALSRFITKYFETETPVEPENLCIVPGVTAAFEMAAAAVCNPYEAFLCPAPYYVRIHNDFEERAQVKIVPVSMIDKNDSDGKFTLTVEAVSKAYEEATAKGIKVHGILIVNPCNPLGTIVQSKSLLKIFNYAKTKKLIVMMNEIYTLSIFDEKSEYKSILSYFSKLPDPERVLWMWGASKDFCIPGMRFGAIYSQNKEILQCVRRFLFLQPIAAPIENMLSRLVLDYEWLDKYLAENKSRLGLAFEHTSKRLTEIEVPHTKAQGGFFTFLDFRKFLKEQTFEEERKLSAEFQKNGVFLLTGESQCCAQPGWFRMVFTLQRGELDEGLNRMENILSTHRRYDSEE